MTKQLLCCLFVLAACDGVSSDPAQPGTFDEELPEFQTATCKVDAQCLQGDEAACRADVATDMADAKAQLDDAGERRCAECMHVKTRELQAILDANCDIDAADEAAVLAACDLNPNDGVDMPDEACAGFP